MWIIRQEGVDVACRLRAHVHVEDTEELLVGARALHAAKRQRDTPREAGDHGRRHEYIRQVVARLRSIRRDRRTAIARQNELVRGTAIESGIHRELKEERPSLANVARHGAEVDDVTDEGGGAPYASDSNGVAELCVFVQNHGIFLFLSSIR